MRRSSIFETMLGFSLLWTLAGCSDSVVRPDPRDVATLGVANSAPLAEATPRDLEIIGGSANGINDAGAVAGHVVTTSQIRAFVWTPQEGMQELIVGPGNAHATDIDNGGMVVGCTDEPRAFIWSAGAGFRDLGTLGGSYACALGMNNKGDVVGYSFTETGAMRAFI